MTRQGQRLVGARARSLRKIGLGTTAVGIVLLVIRPQLWLAVLLTPFVVFWALQVRSHVGWDEKRILVQNPFRRYVIEPGEVAYVDGTIRFFRRRPYFVLRDGRRIPISAYGSQNWFHEENADAAELAETLRVSFEAD